MPTLLIGATGFLGSHVAARLGQRDLAVLVRPTSDRSYLPPNVEIRVGDLNDLASIARALERIDTLVYCASMGFGHIPPLVPVLEAAGVKRGVFISSTAIFTTLPTRARALRLEAERAVQASRLAWTILRPTMIYGDARDRNISRLLRFLRRAPVYPLFGDGRALHQPIYVGDLADAVLATLDSPNTRGCAYNVAGSAPISYVNLVRTTARAVRREIRFVRVPLQVASAAARLASMLPAPRVVTPEQVLRLAEDKAFDYTDAVRDFGFRTRAFAEGVALEAVALGLGEQNPGPGEGHRAPTPCVARRTARPR
jgi:nucleoside-diphosphate-sugar epimerase